MENKIINWFLIEYLKVKSFFNGILLDFKVFYVFFYFICSFTLIIVSFNTSIHPKFPTLNFKTVFNIISEQFSRTAPIRTYNLVILQMKKVILVFNKSILAKILFSIAKHSFDMLLFWFSSFIILLSLLNILKTNMFSHFVHINCFFA